MNESTQHPAGCAICDYAELRLATDTLGGNYHCCPRCGYCQQVLVHNRTRHDQFTAEQHKHYDDESICLLPIYQRMQSSRVKRRLRVMRRYLPSGRLLEVGPGNAEVLIEAQKSGYHVSAVEHSATLVDHIRTRSNIPVFLDAFESMALTPGQYDGFLSFHVIEHVADPEAHLRQAATIVRPGGFAFVATPNAKSWEHRLAGQFSPNYSTAHLQLFTPVSLCRLLAKTGWDVLEVTTPSYVDAWLRFISALRRRLKGGAPTEIPRGDMMRACASGHAMPLIEAVRILTMPGRLIQEWLKSGNEIMIVAVRC